MEVQSAISAADIAAPAQIRVTVHHPTAGGSTNAVYILVFRPGDMSGDGDLDGEDLVMLAQYLAGYPCALSVPGDVDDDADADSSDLVLLQNTVNGNP